MDMWKSRMGLAFLSWNLIPLLQMLYGKLNGNVEEFSIVLSWNRKRSHYSVTNEDMASLH